jgi:5'-3' exoribonuclease 1
MMDSDGYINESGLINTRRLQVVLNEMATWDQESFEREYSDMNWYKGKQAKYANGPQNGRKQEGLGELFLSFPFATLSLCDQL